MRPRRLAVPAALACAAVLVPASAAAAEEPERTGWWNRVSAPPAALPQPQTQEGDLRVAGGPDGPLAFSAVLYSAPASDAASLVLTVREGSVVGSPELAACPTLDTEWGEGGNQPYDKAPEYDCDIGASVGTVAADGRTVTFDLDTGTQVEEGVWSLAIVPQPDGSGAPFALDLEAPGPESFTAEQPSTFDDTSTGAGSDAETSTGGGGEAGVLMPDGFVAPPSEATAAVEMPPLVAGGEVPAPATAPEPAVAAGPANAPALLTTPAGVVQDMSSGRRLLALLVLAGGSAAVGYAAGQQRPGPRLLGGRARLGTPALAGAAALPVTMDRDDRPRGIGRFAKARDTAPRRLR